ncbi:uncharacterized protein LOC108979433 [Juglans regia]|nr:uncharacterized protein LOC108979433 [Juglans regia]
MFLWRACHKSLPTNLNLSKRKITESNLCPVCKREPESVIHALWSCVAVQDVWGICSRKLQKMKVRFHSFKDLLSHLESEVSEGDFEVFATTVYLVWKRRNELVFEKKFENLSKLIYNSYQKLRDFKDANASCPSRHSDRPQAAEWTPPQVNGFKANWDATIDRSMCKIGIGVVVRNWEGKLIATMRSQRTLFPEAKLAEALAALKAVILCKHLQLQNLILEGDTLNVVQDINAERRD